jgi:hypothetical protein
MRVRWNEYHSISESYTGGQTGVENMRMVDDHACNSPIGTHLRARDNKP